MPSLSHYPDGISRLEALRRLLARADAEAATTSRPTALARLWATWAALWRLWRRA